MMDRIAAQQKEVIKDFVAGELNERELRQILNIKEKGRTTKPKKERRMILNAS